VTNFAVFAASQPPAGGAALAEVIGASTAAGLLTALLLWLGFGHRSGRVDVLGRLAAHAERRTGMPGWVSLPAGLATVSLLTAVFGMYWDISLHIDNGRDPGPLANPAHYFILAGLFGIFSAGFIAMALPKERPSAVSLRITRDWHAPLGGVLICACGAFSLAGFPLDDVWHRIFGQDVTLWGPTHLMLIGGAAMTLVGIAVLTVEGLRHNARAGRAEKPWMRFAHVVPLYGGFMLGLSTFQAEFDFGVPQFRFVFHPILLMVAAGVGLVVARRWGGKGAALGAVAFFLVVRGILALLVGPVLGQTTPHFPLYIVEALVVEVVALRVATDRPLAFGLWSGLGLGTIGLASEWAWSHVWMPIPWPGELFPEAAILGFGAAMGGALIGAWAGYRLDTQPKPTVPWLRRAAVAGAALVAVIVVSSLYKPADAGVRGSVTTTEVASGAKRSVNATVRLSPPNAADDAEWLDATAWQGGGLVLDHLKRVGDGVYRTTEPIPVHGNWKSLIRLHHGNSLTAIPVFLPKDPAIPAREVPARASFTRTFVADHEILQREQKTAAGWLSTVAYAVVAGIALSLLVLLTWALHRLAHPKVRVERVRERKAGPRAAAPTPA
jgi:hypothetical protein